MTAFATTRPCRCSSPCGSTTTTTGWRSSGQGRSGLCVRTVARPTLGGRWVLDAALALAAIDVDQVTAWELAMLTLRRDYANALECRAH